MARTIFLTLSLTASLLAAPAMAESLFCKLDSICPGGSDCAAPAFETVIELTGTDGDAPQMIREGDAFDVTQSQTGAIRRWSGKNMTGETEVLALRTADLAFTGLVIFDGATHQKTSGHCEVR